VRACQGLGIEVLDTLRDIRGPQAAIELFYRRDLHLNPKGTDALARAVFERLVAPHLRDRGEPRGAVP